MAEECRYYYWDAGYSCALKREREGNSSIDSDTVHRYCWGYHYEDCPQYRAGSSSGGCYLTSACVEAMGLADDCHELTVLRAFRDGYMRTTETGPADICHYYHTAPVIVARIKADAKSAAVFEAIYQELVLPCVKLIESARNGEAYEIYKGYVQKLEEKYLAGKGE